MFDLLRYVNVVTGALPDISSIVVNFFEGVVLPVLLRKISFVLFVIFHSANIKSFFVKRVTKRCRWCVGWPTHIGSISWTHVAKLSICSNITGWPFAVFLGLMASKRIRKPPSRYVDDVESPFVNRKSRNTGVQNGTTAVEQMPVETVPTLKLQNGRTLTAKSQTRRASSKTTNGRTPSTTPGNGRKAVPKIAPPRKKQKSVDKTKRWNSELIF